ncbi:MAG: 16S rRNA (cytidine(1402)-2'-O)-methyltransferase [Alphaproteobacteria bacterium]
MSEDLKPEFGLYVTATPIGNLGDLSSRAKKVLEGVDAIICEDTRVTKKLLTRFGIGKPLLSLHEHNETKMIPEILSKLEAGQTLAMVSDAGTPLISDPGYHLVRAVQDKGIPVIPIPGASAPITALMAGGLATDAFMFVGFLSAKEGKKEKALEALKNTPATLIFFESPKRVVKTLGSMVKVFGAEREAVLARELTKIHEEIVRAPLAGLLETFGNRETIKGEIVLLVARGEEEVGGDQDIDAVLLALLETLSVNDAASTLAKLTGQPKKEIYQRALELKK